MAEELLQAFLEARGDALVYQATGDELAKLALELAARARKYWEASNVLLDAAERCARHMRSRPDPDAWPRGLESEIRAILDQRDAANDT